MEENYWKKKKEGRKIAINFEDFTFKYESQYPLSGKYAIELIGELHKDKKLTTVIIEHRLEDVLHREIDRIIVVDKGRIIADDTPDNILKGNLLGKMNIREPLYISLLKYSNNNLEKYNDISSLEKIDFSAAKDSILNWIKFNSPKESKKSENTLLKLENISFSYNDKHCWLKWSWKVNVVKGYCRI